MNSLVPNVAASHLPKNQCGFKANQNTIDIIFVV